MKVAAIQHDIEWLDREANFAALAPKIAAAAASGAELVVLAEMFSTGFAVDDELAEPVDGPSAQFLFEQAAAHRIWVCGSCPELPADDDDRRPYNSFVFAGPDGAAHRYRKIHPFGYGGETKRFRAGDELVSFTLQSADGPVRVAPFVCYDLRFADEFWQLANDVDVYVVPANWPAARAAHWRSLLQARAIENLAYVVGCNRVGSGGGLEYRGDSAIVDPLGEHLATASTDETTLLATIDPQRVAAVRERFGFLNDRR